MQSDFILQVITSSFAGFSASAIIIWLSKQWISERLKNAIRAEYDLKLATHEAQLKAQSDVEIEKLRSQLNLVALEHNVVFSKLHEKRGEAISEIYAHLIKVNQCLSEYVKSIELVGEKPREERYNDLADAHKMFFESFTAKAIFLPEQTARKLEELNKAFVQTGNQFRLIVLNPNNPSPHQMWSEIGERLEGPVRNSMRELEAEFRRLLGDKSSGNGPPIS